MTFNHLVLIGGGHTNVLLIKKWLMCKKLMPEIPVSIISRGLICSCNEPTADGATIHLTPIDLKAQILAL